MLKHTPFHERTAPLVRGANWRRWSGYQVASSYEPTHEREYAAIRNGAALIDVSPLCKYLVSGPDAERMISRTVTRDIARLRPGRVGYTTWCDSHGKVIDDGTVARLDEHNWRITSAEPSLHWFHQCAAGMDVTIADESDSVAALALQGPESRRVLASITDIDIAALPWFGVVQANIGGVPVSVARTGYTGDLGYELFTAADNALQLWDALISAGSHNLVTPAGIWALDIARIEAGLLMAGVDYHSAHHALTPAQMSSPFELGLDWSVRESESPFNGQQALAAERRNPSPWQFVGIEVEWESLEALYNVHGLPPSLPTVAWRTSAPLLYEGEQVGYATSGCWSPLLKKYIALAHVRRPHSETGSQLGMEIVVEHERRVARARVVALPFLSLERRRS